MTAAHRAACPVPAKAAALLLGAIAVLNAAAHAVAAAGAAGPMAWGMAAMGLPCLGCLLHLRPGGHGPRATARHLAFMCAAMVLVHLGWLNLHAAAGQHVHGGTGSLPAAGHGTAMLALAAVELMCLAASTAVLRRLRRHPAVLS